MIKFTAFELKRLFNNKTFTFIYILFLISVLSITLFYNLSGATDYKSLIGVIDLEKSQKTNEFIKKINESNSIEAVIMSDNIKIEEAKEEIKRGKLGAVLLIPSNFFENMPNEKLSFISAEGDVISPALIDLISQAFIMDVVEKELEKRVSLDMNEKKAEDSVKEYNSLKKETKFDLIINEDTFNEQKGLKTAAEQDIIDGANSIFMYISAFTVLFVAISLHISSIRSIGILKRIYLTPDSGSMYFFSRKVLEYTLIALPIIISSIILSLKLNMLITPFLFFVIGSLISIYLVFEIGNFIYTVLGYNTAFSIVVFLNLVLALVGGAFFSPDMLPSAILLISKFSPFNVISSVLYGATDMNFSIIPILITYFVINIILLSANYVIQQKQLTI